MGTLLLALAAGALTTLSPCVLPVLPIVLFGAASEHRFGPLALLGGLVVAFTAAGMLVAGAASAFDAGAIRGASAALLIAFGLVVASARLRERFAALSSPFSSVPGGVAARYSPRGLRGQFLLGILLGAVWTPCSGPTLGTAIALAAGGGTAVEAAIVMLAFGMGAGAPLLALAYGSRGAMKARGMRLARAARVATPMLGVALVLAGAAVLLGLDRRLEAALVGAMPGWLLELTTRF